MLELRGNQWITQVLEEKNGLRLDQKPQKGEVANVPCMESQIVFEDFLGSWINAFLLH